MSQSVKEKKNINLKETFGAAGRMIARWLYLILLLGAVAYAIFVWNKYILKADWSEEKKKQYVNEQSVFSFNSKSYQQVLDFMKHKKDKLENTQKYSGRDIIFPEGF